MPKKLGVNSKSVDAKAKKDEAKKGKAAAAEKEQEDRAWREAGEGAKTRAQAKKEEQEKQRAEAAAKKLEAKKMAEEEAAQLTSSSKKSSSKSAGTPKGKKRIDVKVTSHQLRQQKEADKQAAAEEAKRRDLAAKREVAEEDYGQLVDRENINREQDGVDASGMEAAIAALVIGDSTPEDRHPEKRARAAYAAWSEQWIADMKLEKPGLRQQQYKDLCWKAWQRSPDNPLNQVKPPS